MQPKWDDPLDQTFVAPARARTDRHDNFTDTSTAVVREEKVVWIPLSLAGQVLTLSELEGGGCLEHIRKLEAEISPIKLCTKLQM